MKIVSTVMALSLVLSSFQVHAQTGSVKVQEAQTASGLLRQQYAELEDLKTQLELVRKAGAAESVTFMISAGLVAGGLILEILGSKASMITRGSNSTTTDVMIYLGTGGGITAGVLLYLDNKEIDDLQKKITEQQDLITQTAQQLK